MRLFTLISEHRYFQNTIIVLILVNAVLLGLETNDQLYSSFASSFHAFDKLLLWIFTLEIVIRLIGTRPFFSFFKNGWNVFDFLIVASSLLFAGGQFITVFRILRILRVLRTFSLIPSLRRMITALMLTIPALGNILLLMGIVFYIFGVTGTMLFADAAPEYFGSFSKTLLTLFQVVTLESWASGVMRPLLETAPWSWIYFVLFVLMGTFIIFNLFVGAIVNSMDRAEANENDLPSSSENTDTDLRAELTSMRQELKELKQMLRQQTNSPE